MILMSSPMFTWSGTRNLILSRMGSCFSPLYLSMITCRTQTDDITHLLSSDWLEEQGYKKEMSLLTCNLLKLILNICLNSKVQFLN